MIDTITLKFNNYNHSEVLKILNNFENPTISNNQKGQLIKAKHKNFHFYLGDKFFKATGSITKLVHSTNQLNFDITDVQQGLNYLSDLLQLNITDATLSRIDIGFNISLEHPISHYLPLLITPTCAKEFNVSKKGIETKEFQYHNRQTIFYNKLAELQNKGVQIYDHNQNINLLRYELKLTNRLPELLKVSKVTCDMLFQPWFYERLLKLWLDHYNAIPKLYRGKPAINMQTPRSFLLSLFPFGLDAVGGVNNVIKLINTTPSIKRSNKSRLIKLIKDHGAHISKHDPSELIDELTTKVYSIAKHAI